MNSKVNVNTRKVLAQSFNSMFFKAPEKTTIGPIKPCGTKHKLKHKNA